VETGISLHRDPVEELGAGSFTGDFRNGRKRGQEICKRRLWKRATLFIGAPLGVLGGGFVYRGH
jgi:hypothetical protein